MPLGSKSAAPLWSFATMRSTAQVSGIGSLSLLFIVCIIYPDGRALLNLAMVWIISLEYLTDLSIGIGPFLKSHSLVFQREII